MAAVSYLKQLAEVGHFFVLWDFGERLLALLGDLLIEVATVNAGMKLSFALRAGVIAPHLIEQHVEFGTALSTPRHALRYNPRLPGGRV